jgi:hypothetical protein
MKVDFLSNRNKQTPLRCECFQLLTESLLEECWGIKIYDVKMVYLWAGDS